MGVYRFLAILMIVSPISAYILNAHILRKDNAIYWVEFCRIWAFAAYWIVKGIEMSEPDTEKMVPAGVRYDPPKLNIAGSVKSMLSGGKSATTPTPPSPWGLPLTRRKPGMVYGSFERRGLAAASGRSPPRRKTTFTTTFAACASLPGCGISRSNLYDNLDPRRPRGPRTQEEESRDQRYHRALEILLAVSGIDRHS